MEKLSLQIFKNAELIPILLGWIGVFLAVSLLQPLFDQGSRKKKEEQSVFPFLHIWRAPSYTRKDAFFLICICACSSILLFTKLGSTSFPHSTWQPSKTGQSFILECTGDTDFDRIVAIFGEGDNNARSEGYQLGFHDILLEGSNDLKHFETLGTLNEKSIYQYQILDGSWDYRYIRITSSHSDDTISEIGLRKQGSQELLPLKVKEDDYSSSAYPAVLVIDEQSSVCLTPTYFDECYFDEVYHVRNAWEIANQQHMYASVHPLLGTSLIALSIKIFGMNPFAWRFPGALFGILMLPFFYDLLKVLLQKRRWAMFGTLLFAVDFMHLTTSRIATLEPFSVFWILAMFDLMVRYVRSDFYFCPLRKNLKTLFFCGLCMSLGIATKWTACYSAVGLAILLFAHLFQAFQDYRLACEQTTTLEDGNEKIAAEFIRTHWWKYFWCTIGSCILFFLLLTVLVYALSYLWTPVWRDGWSIQNVLNQIQYMYNYHSNLQATHPYQSSWWMWLLDVRPIWYFGRATASGYSSIACFTNPVLSWTGLVAILYTLYKAVRTRELAPLCIGVGYLTALLPWVTLVDRCVFAYHFYPTSLFMIAAIVFALKDLCHKYSFVKKYALIILLLSILVFLFFLPVLTGFETTTGMIKAMEWFGTWYFG